MRGPLLCLAFFALPPVLLAADPARGKLLIVGGGRIDDVLRRDLVKRGGRCMVIVPFASSNNPTDQNADRRWIDAGAKEVYRITPSDLPEAKRRLIKADFIWTPGGKQSVLAQKLRELGLADLIRQRFREGVTFGGTSAGASIVSRYMIRGFEGKTEILEGLGLWPEVIVDQHFIKRNRQARLSALIQERPHLLGVGIDESTGIEVNGRRFEVFGTSKVIVLDARLPQGKDRMKLHTLPAGKRFDLDRGVLAE